MSEPAKPDDIILQNRPSPLVVREFNDRGTLWLLEDPANVRDLIRIINPALVEPLDFGRAVRINRSFVPPDLQKSESDLIYRVPYVAHETDIWVYILLEQQTLPDSLMALRLLSYMNQLWEAQRREWLDRKVPKEQQRLFVILPIVFYTGEDVWKAPLQLLDMMEVPPGWQQFVPAWETLFLNLQQTTPEQLTGQFAAIGNALRVLQVAKEPVREFRKVLEEAMSGLEGLTEEQSGQWLRIAWYLMLLIINRRSPTEKPELTQFVFARANESKFHERSEVNKMEQTYAEYFEAQLTERLTKSLTQSLTESLTQSLTRQITQEITEQVKQEVTQEITEQVKQEVTQEITEQVKQEVTLEVTHQVEAQQIRKALLITLTAKFGDIPVEEKSAIERAGMEQMEDMLSRAATATTLDQVRILPTE